MRQSASNEGIGIFMYEYDGVPVRVYVPSPEIRRKAPVNGGMIYVHGGGATFEQNLLNSFLSFLTLAFNFSKIFGTF